MEVAKTIRQVSYVLLVLGIIAAVILLITGAIVSCVMSGISAVILFIVVYGLAEIIDWIGAIYRKLEQIEKEIKHLK